MANEGMGKIEDIKKAEAAAHAENPFQSALADYRNSLSPEGKAALEDISNRRADEAIAAFDQAKSLEDPRIKILKETAAKSLSIKQWTKQINDEFGGSNPNAVTDIEALLRFHASPKLEGILSNPNLSMADKKSQIEALAPRLAMGVFRSAHFDKKNVEALAYRLPSEYGGAFSAQEREAVLANAEGYIISHLASNDPSKALTLMRALAQGEKVKLSEVLKRYLPLITKAHQLVNADQRFTYFDDSMRHDGFVWTPESKTYVSFE